MTLYFSDFSNAPDRSAKLSALSAALDAVEKLNPNIYAANENDPAPPINYTYIERIFNLEDVEQIPYGLE